jgi:DNA-binding transcriptional MerR regulator
MPERSYTIGQVAKLSGLSVRRLRFYADEGLLPAARTESGYRLFNDADLVRIDLITHLRKADVSLDEIRDVLIRKTSIRDVLALRLKEVETLIASQRRVASALRAALRSPEPTNEDLRRTWTMLNLSQAERRDAIARFFDKVSDNLSVADGWKDWMISMSTPDLPEEPTAEQIDAWIELQDMLNDPAFLNLMRENAKGAHSPKMKHAVFAEVQKDLLQRAADAMTRGLEPTSDVGRQIGDDFVKGWARAHGVEANAEYYARLKRHLFEYKPASHRYWSLVKVLGGLRGKNAQAEQPPMHPVELEALNKRWMWVDKAMKHRLSQEA